MSTLTRVFSTNLAAFLIAKGHHLSEIVYDGPDANFMFPPGDGIADEIRSFELSQAVANIVHFTDVKTELVRRIKSRLP